MPVRPPVKSQAHGYVPRNHDEAVVSAVLNNLVNKVVVEEEFRQQMENLDTGEVVQQQLSELERDDDLESIDGDDCSSDGEAKEAIEAAVASLARRSILGHSGHASG